MVFDKKNASDSDTLKFLKSLGKLDKNFDGKQDLLELASSHRSKEIRTLAIANLAKLNDFELFDFYKSILRKETHSLARREAVSAIGRLRDARAIDYLKSLLLDPDPNVVLQAIRGLLIFRKIDSVNQELLKLTNHENEVVRKIINIEFLKENDKKLNPVSFPEYLKNTIILGDVIDTLKKVDEESVHLTFTSPPYYNARDYSIYNSYESYLDFLESVVAEIYRVTKEGRFLAINTSPVIVPRVGRKYESKRYPIPFDLHARIIRQGWDYVDDIVWAKPEPSVKNRNASFSLHRKPLAYKPNCITESIVIYRKSSNRLIDWIYEQYPDDVLNASKVRGEFETTNVWHIDPVYSKNHSAVFPLELCDKIISYYSFKGDLVFDPFAGSGSVGLSALRNDRYFFLAEKNKKYFDYMCENFQNDLFTSDIQIMTT